VSKVAAIILAAGRSSRFEGGNKLLAEIDGSAMVRRVACEVAASPVNEIILVTGAGDGAIASAAGAGRWRHIINPEPARGLSSSLKAGLAALSADTGGALVILADMPGVTAALIAKLCEAFNAHGGEKIVYPQNTRGVQGNPVLWPHALFADLMQLEGDSGGKKLLAMRAHFCQPLHVSGDDAFTDIDTRADLARMTRRLD
jgi:molybdenum cofactor cytidylyltransferase